MVACPRCGTANPDRARFCMECTAPLVGDASVRRERRWVSVLFADLVGFTSRSERLDVEDVAGFLEPYHEALRRAVERHGGVVGDFAGDGMMAVFGAPAAHEDDAERAVRAGLAIQEAVAEMRSEDHRLDLHVRVGINTGEALVTVRPNGTVEVVGDTVNTAARVEAAAPTDEVWVAEPTRRVTGRVVTYAAAEPIVAKGKAEPVVVWAAVAARSIVHGRLRHTDAGLVGRDAELGLLTAALRRAVGEPSVQLVTVIGAPGIGKSRLVDELFAHVDESPDLIRWRRGRSLAYGEGVAFWALGEVAKSEAGILESDPATVAVAKLDDAVAAVLPDADDRAWVSRHLRPLVGLDDPTAASAGLGQGEAFAAWRRFIEALAEDRATVLVFEDVHWADEVLLDFIDVLADRAGGVPLLVVCTARPELLDRRPAWGGGKLNALTINLAPLSEAETSTLVEQLLAASISTSQVHERVIAHAEGNPLYAHEYVRMLRDQHPEATSIDAEAGSGSDVPTTIHAVIAARLDTLPTETRRFVQDAAVIGRTGWLGAACAVSDISPAEAAEHLHAAEQRQFLRRARRSSVADDTEFSFTHALIQDVAYRQLPRSDRAHKHERIAVWIESLAGDRADKAEFLAHHYEAALRLRKEMGEETATLEPRARQALAEAGRQAAALNAHSVAVAFFRSALALTSPDDIERPRLLFDHATASFHAGQADEEMLKEALDAQTAAQDWHSAVKICLVLDEYVDFYLGAGTRGEDYLRLAAEYASRAPYAHVASIVAYAQAQRPSLTGHGAGYALDVARRAILQAERAGDDQGYALVLMRRGTARITSGDLKGVEDSEKAAAILAEYAHPKTSIAYENLAWARIVAGDFDGASDAFSECVVWTQRVSYSRYLGMTDAVVATARYHTGDWQAALSLSTDLINDDSRMTAAVAAWTRGRIALAQGDTSVALRDSQMIVSYGTDSGEHEELLCGLALMALAHRARGEAQEAEACDRFFAHWHEVGSAPGAAHAAAELAPLQGHVTALRHLANSLPIASRWHQALNAIADSRPADAADVYREMGSRPLEAAARLIAAKDHARQDQPADATQQAQQALSFYEDVGATRYADEARNLLRALPIRPAQT